MSNQIHPIQSYTFSGTESLLLDANIWLYLYAPQGDPKDWRTAIYSTALRKILTAKSSIFIDALVLSEFINSYARLVYNQLPSGTKPANFKTFHNSGSFQPFAQNIADDARQIMKICQRIESCFESIDLNVLFSNYESGNSDFNDQVLQHLCKSKDLKLVTHNADFKDANITILTANSKLLN